MKKAQVYKNFIGGKWVSSHTKDTFENVNPADTDEVIGQFQKSDARDVDDAITAATDAFKKWRLVPAPKRGEIMYRVAERLLKDKEKVSRSIFTGFGSRLLFTHLASCPGYS